MNHVLVDQDDLPDLAIIDPRPPERSYAVARTETNGEFVSHATEWEWAELALEHADNPNGPISITTACGQVGWLLRHRDVADSGEPQQLDVFAPAGQGVVQWCPTCVWSAAVELDITDTALEVFTPAADDLELLASQLPEPLLARKVCEAILASSTTHHGPGRGSGELVQLLAYATAHAPTVVLPEPCSDGGCDHERSNDGSGLCGFPDVDVVCPACSVWAGRWAGEWQGLLLANAAIDAPCEALRRLADRFHVQLDGTSEVAA